MSKIVWTLEQQRAIEERGCNLLVAAGAGSGKTAVLVERIIRKLLAEQEPLDLENLLVVTFTNAAAAEMRQKVAAALSSACRQDPHNKHLLRQLSLLPQAQITTIHSFCLDLIRRNFCALGLDASFRVAGELEQGLLLRQTLEKFLEQRYEENDQLLPLLADAYGGVKDDSRLMEIMLELYEFSRSQPHPQQWLQEAVALFEDCSGLDDYPWSGVLLEQVKSDLRLAGSFLQQAISIAAMEEALLPWADSLQTEADSLQMLDQEDASLQKMMEKLAAMQFGSLPRGIKEHKEQKEDIQKLRRQSKKLVGNWQQELCRRPVDDFLQDLRLAAPLMRELAQLISDFNLCYERAKRKKNLIDFNDMEHMCLALLEDESNGLQAGLQNRFQEILVDEYQDINGVQETILQLLSRGHNMFVVGDIKQSIYGFRLAEPQLFLAKYLAFGQEHGGRRVELNQNFRSRPQLLRGINDVFGRLMSRESAGLDYDESVFLYSDKEAVGPPASLYILDNAPEEADAAESEEELPAAEPMESAEIEGLNSWQKEAAFIGRQILQLHEEGYAFKDMVILLRSLRSRQAQLAETLLDMGIPTLSAIGQSYLEAAEVSLMISLLRLVDNPVQDIPLAAVLRSPLVGLDLDQLLNLRLGEQQSLYQSLQQAALSTEDAELSLKAERFLHLLAKWRRQSGHMGVSRLIRQIYEDTGLYHLAGALPEGQLRQANLQSFYGRAVEYEKTSFKGLLHFLRFIDDAKAKADENSFRQEAAEDEDAVPIISIHKSKGLEYPVVFVAGLGSAFYLRGKNNDVLWHKDLGLGPKIVRRDKRVKYPTLAHAAIGEALFHQAMAEEIRILYVAMTRAKERLILTASVPNAAAAAKNRWALTSEERGFLPVSAIYRDKSPLDWLVRSLLDHQNGQPLRRLCGLPEPALAADLPDNWHISIEKPYPYAAKAEPKPALLQLPEGQLLPASDFAEQVERILSYRYAYEGACSFAAKITVTQLQKLAYDQEEAREQSHMLLEEPPQAEQEQVTIERGLAYHWLLQHLPLSCCADVDSLRQKMSKLADGNIIPGEWLQITKAEHLYAFFASELGQRMAQAKQVARELPFIYALPAQELQKQAAAEDCIILQGVIDLLFLEEDGWVIVDYKSGGKRATAEELRLRYGQQIAYYRRAVAGMMAQPVKECWLYMLEDGRRIKL
jgi:ATP-dependent helicase/nuclease subunit A